MVHSIQFFNLLLLLLLSQSSTSTTIEIETVHSDILSTPRTTTSTRLKPKHVAKLRIYNQWDNSTTTLGRTKESYRISHGSVLWPPPVNRSTKFSVISNIMTSNTIKNVLRLLKTSNFDIGLDSVDAMPTHEMYVHKGPLEIMSNEDVGVPSRDKVRTKLRKLLAPAEARITEYVRTNWPNACDGEFNRKCRACYSLVRKYNDDGRKTHMMHRDGQALVTAVVSLSEYGVDFAGGLYVAANGQGRQSFALRKGDVILHQYDLLHGVHVLPVNQKKPIERWSWIMWFKDSETCQQYGHEWSRTCAHAGDALCQYTYGWRIHLDPTLSKETKEAERERWMTKSAENGFAEAMFKVGRNHLGRNNMTGAEYWFRKAIAENDPDASYQVGYLLLKGLLSPLIVSGGDDSDDGGNGDDGDISKATALLAQREALVLYENAAKWGSSPFAGAPFAMYNLGVVWLYGYAGVKRNPKTAMKWFHKSGLPEGLMAVSLYYKSKGKTKRARLYQQRANTAGFGKRPSRDQALFGLHSDWPKGPPQW